MASSTTESSPVYQQAQQAQQAQQHQHLKIPATLQKEFPVWLDPEFRVSQVTRTDLNINDPIPQLRLFALEQLLSAEECQYFVTQAEEAGFESIRWEYSKNYRDCTRLTAQLPELARTLWQRLALHLQSEDLLDVKPYGIGNEGKWIPCGVNPCFRFSRYQAGQFFDYHRDGAFVQDDQTQSIYTSMIYLNDQFRGGTTDFIDLPSKDSQKERAKFIDVSPKTGQGLIFNHDVWHRGAHLDQGTKYILRTDLMFRRVDDFHLQDSRTMLGPQYPLYLEAQKWYYRSIEYQKQNEPVLSTECYLKAQEIQLEFRSLPDPLEQAQENRLTNSLYDFPLSREETLKVLSYVSLKDLPSVAKSNLALAHRVREDEQWRLRYAQTYQLPLSQLPAQPDYHWASVFRYRYQADQNWQPVIFYFTEEKTWILRSGEAPIEQPTQVAQVCGHYWCRGSGHENCVIGDEIARFKGDDDNSHHPSCYETQGLFDQKVDGEDYFPSDFELYQEDELSADKSQVIQTKTKLNRLLIKAFLNIFLSLDHDRLIRQTSQDGDWDTHWDHWHFHWEQVVQRRPVVIVRPPWLGEADCQLIREIVFQQFQVPYLFFFSIEEEPIPGEAAGLLCTLMEHCLLPPWQQKFEVNQSPVKMF